MSTLTYQDLVDAANRCAPHPPTCPGMIGMSVFVTPDLLPAFVQVMFPRSKKKRIRKKWSANPGNYEYAAADNSIPDGESIRLGGALYVNPRTFRALGDYASDHDGVPWKSEAVQAMTNAAGGRGT